MMFICACFYLFQVLVKEMVTWYAVDIRFIAVFFFSLHRSVENVVFRKRSQHPRLNTVPAIYRFICMYSPIRLYE